jgi:membrane protein implicated in regulation of membrane protease activity
VRKSEWIGAAALGVSAAITAGLWWLMPTLPWWAYPPVWLFGAGMLASQWTRYAADKGIADRPDKID